MSIFLFIFIFLIWRMVNYLKFGEYLIWRTVNYFKFGEFYQNSPNSPNFVHAKFCTLKVHQQDMFILI